MIKRQKLTIVRLRLCKNQKTALHTKFDIFWCIARARVLVLGSTRRLRRRPKRRSTSSGRERRQFTCARDAAAAAICDAQARARATSVVTCTRCSRRRLRLRLLHARARGGGGDIARALFLIDVLCDTSTKSARAPQDRRSDGVFLRNDERAKGTGGATLSGGGGDKRRQRAQNVRFACA